ncbi:hypothetical protein AB0P05_41555 [Streptomyces flaveolus]|uniref:hypothetical protein n=1 Tax=Streptomyces flaveolus TaxID=67297 RepID=UPI00343B6EFF
MPAGIVGQHDGGFDALAHQLAADLEVGSELERRIALDGDVDGVPRLMVVIDRADATLRHLARYWETFRQKGDPKRSPAIAALEAVLYEG